MARLRRRWQGPSAGCLSLLLAAVGGGPAAAADLVLADGQPLRLAGVEIADLRTLRALIGGDALRPQPQPPPFTDRHGRTVAQVTRESDGLWVQQALVAAGAARVRPQPGEAGPTCVALLAVEAQARAAGRGLWADPPPGWAVLTPDAAAHALGRFAVVEGTVRAVATVGGTTFLNFGSDWRQDFTAALGKAEARAVNAPALEGRRVRVRGWLRSYNGPFMTLDDACAVEVPP